MFLSSPPITLDVRRPTCMQEMNARRFHQFSLRSALALLILVAMALGTLPHIQAAREAARRQKCANNLRQYSGPMVLDVTFADVALSASLANLPDTLTTCRNGSVTSRSP